MITGNVPGHLLVAARTGFLNAVRAAQMDWQKIAVQLNLTAAEQELVDLGAAPMPIENHVIAQDFIEKSKTVKPRDWNITIWISYNAVKDDQTGSLERRVRSAGANFQKHINKRVFQVLNAGDGQTYGPCYDAQDFFDSDHVDKGGDYQTAQDNEYALALSLDNFETVYVAAQGTKDDRGEYLEYLYNTIVCHPSLARIAAQICNNPEDYGTGNRAMNPYSGKLTYITSPHLDTTAWYLAAANEEVKPLILAVKEQPNLQSSWFDPEQPDGGRYYFKFYARYEVHYGLWQLIYQGNT